MACFAALPEEFLLSLETYLDQGSKEECQELKEIPLRLTQLLEKDELAICEKAVQLLGNAVGKKRTLADEIFTYTPR